MKTLRSKRKKMIREIEELYRLHQDEILREAAERYGFEKENLKKLGSFESYVYEVDCENIILKITHSIRRTKEYVIGEMEFVRYLAENGVLVSTPVLSQNGKSVETIQINDGYFLVYAFTRAKGRELEEHELNSAFNEEWGRLVGRMHTLAKKFEPSRPMYRRQAWYEEDVLDYDKYIPSSQKIVHKKKEKLFKALKSLPQNTSTYGLTHNDIHYGNIYVDEECRLTVFDFDDSSYHWYVNDIAIVVHSILPGYDQVEQFGTIVEQFLVDFMRGYLRENKIDKSWMRKVPEFLRLYDLINYGIFHQVWDMENLSEARKRTLARVRQRIENETSIVEADFAKFGV
jgi:Ser/Thr protein kinase RdoA (MazF antagonist)